MPPTIRILAIVTFGLMLSACASSVSTRSPDTFEPPAVSPDPGLANLAWWQLRFKLSWPPDEPPDFSGHLLIAEQVLLPQIIKHQEALPLWRFHRRAGRDGAGHQFSLIFLADEKTATNIGDAIGSDELVAWLKQNGMLENTSLGRRGPEELAKLEETSDPVWPIEMQRSWPWFIMGVSTAWLMQVQDISQRQGLPETATYTELHDHYRRVSATMDAQWRDFGQHAYLHHLNAVYGYQPIKIRSSELKTF